MTFSAADMAPIHAPSISYAALSPMLIMLGVACAGVLIEAFVPRDWRARIQVPLALAGCVAALVAVVLIRNKHLTTAAGAIAVDGPTLFIEGTLAALGIVSVLLVSERSLDTAGSALVASAAVAVGSSRDRAQATTTRVQTEAYPLVTFALSGMMLFPASNNLLVMFVSLEVLSLPLYLLTGFGSAAPAAVPGGGGQVLPAGRVRLGVLPVRAGDAVRVRRHR